MSENTKYIVMIKDSKNPELISNEYKPGTLALLDQYPEPGKVYCLDFGDITCGYDRVAGVQFELIDILEQPEKSTTLSIAGEDFTADVLNITTNPIQTYRKYASPFRGNELIDSCEIKLELSMDHLLISQLCLDGIPKDFILSFADSLFWRGNGIVTEIKPKDDYVVNVSIKMVGIMVVSETFSNFVSEIGKEFPTVESKNKNYGIKQIGKDDEINAMAGMMQLLDIYLGENFGARARATNYINEREKDNL